jgi:hypothetical protein
MACAISRGRTDRPGGKGRWHRSPGCRLLQDLLATLGGCGHRLDLFDHPALRCGRSRCARRARYSRQVSQTRAMSKMVSAVSPHEKRTAVIR